MAGGNKTNKKQNKQNKKVITDKEITKKNSKSGGSSSGCCSTGAPCWLLFFGIFVTIAAIAGLLTYDTNTNGNGVFAKSATGRFLERTGALPYVEWGWEKSMSRGARVYKWTKFNVIPYVKLCCDTLTPYMEFLRDFFKMMLNGIKLSAIGLCEYVDKKLPIVGAYIDQYSPGLSAKIADVFISVWSAICQTSSVLRTRITEFFTTTVFVGKLSPENLGKALNETEYTVLRYMRWFNERVDFYAKIQ